jgi:signal peptide peptidase SppA
LAKEVAGLTLTQKEVEARIGTVEEPTPRSSSAIAVLPVWGTITHRNFGGGLWALLFGGASTEALSAKVRQLAADDTVSAIVLDVDSSGGVYEGVPELWKTIYEAREQKKVIAVANGLAASAAYYIASAATEVVVIPSGLVGSIGVVHFHVEMSEMLEREGVKYTVTRAGKYKAEGNPFEPLTDEAQEHIQGLVDDAYGQFVKDVAKGRGVKVSDVRNGFGQGRVVTAKEALAEGMVDRIGTLDEVLTKLAPRSRKLRAEEDISTTTVSTTTDNEQLQGEVNFTIRIVDEEVVASDDENIEDVKSEFDATTEKLKLRQKWRKRRRDLTTTDKNA